MSLNFNTQNPLFFSYREDQQIPYEEENALILLDEIPSAIKKLNEDFDELVNPIEPTSYLLQEERDYLEEQISEINSIYKELLTYYANEQSKQKKRVSKAHNINSRVIKKTKSIQKFFHQRPPDYF